MVKIDYKKELKDLYSPPKTKPGLVEVPTLHYLMIDGSGYPGTSKEYQDAMEALFPVSYALKFMVKKQQGIDYGVLPLEGLWWADDMTKFKEDRDSWKWTSMIVQPEHVTEALFKEAVAQVEKKKAPLALGKMRFEKYCEGTAAHIMHIGPFSEEGPTIEKLHAFIHDCGYELAGKHHEIYLSDMRKTAPGKMKTVIRQPLLKMS